MPERTLVLQSHKQPLPYAWLSECLDSVRNWAGQSGFSYRFLDDELFALLDRSLRDKFADRPVILSDLARLRWIQRFLEEGWQRVVWLDADVLVFSPGRLVPPAENYMVGREVWVQQSGNGRFKVYRKVHNAYLVFCRGNSFLDYYIATAQQLLERTEQTVPAQFIGPKLLTAYHNICAHPVQEEAAMFSPEVIRDISAGGGKALELFNSRSICAPAAANLSASLNTNDELMNKVIEVLLSGRAGEQNSPDIQLFSSQAVIR